MRNPAEGGEALEADPCFRSRERRVQLGAHPLVQGVVLGLCTVGVKIIVRGLQAGVERVEVFAQLCGGMAGFGRLRDRGLRCGTGGRAGEQNAQQQGGDDAGTGRHARLRRQ